MAWARPTANALRAAVDSAVQGRAQRVLGRTRPGNVARLRVQCSVDGCQPVEALLLFRGWVVRLILLELARAGRRWLNRRLFGFELAEPVLQPLDHRVQPGRSGLASRDLDLRVVERSDRGLRRLERPRVAPAEPIAAESNDGQTGRQCRNLGQCGHRKT